MFHLLAIEHSGNESETFFHDIPLLPGHNDLPQREKVLPMSPEWSVTSVSGRTKGLLTSVGFSFFRT
jgi:hypothetical protein